MKTRFLEEAPGVRSWARLQSLLLTILLMIIAGYQAYKQDISIELIVILGLLATAPKVLQKVWEKKYDNSSSVQS